MNPLQEVNVNIFKHASEIVDENMSKKERTVLYVIGGIFYTLVIGAIVMIVRKIRK